MADMVDQGSRWGTKQIKTGYQDMGDGTFAEIVSIGGEGGRIGVVVHNVATNGDIFPVDSETSYTYDSGGINILTLERITPEGVTYRQTWIRNDMGQLQTKSGWVRL